MSDQVKRFILDNGPCRPTGKFPKDKNNNCFSDDKYFLRTEAGLELPRNWICYSPTLDVSYCEPCWLFGKNNNQTWADGFNDWRHLTHAIKKTREIKQACGSSTNTCSLEKRRDT